MGQRFRTSALVLEKRETTLVALQFNRSRLTRERQFLHVLPFVLPFAYAVPHSRSKRAKMGENPFQRGKWHGKQTGHSINRDCGCVGRGIDNARYLERKKKKIYKTGPDSMVKRSKTEGGEF